MVDVEQGDADIAGAGAANATKAKGERKRIIRVSTG
jgi:hypothetical protein